MRTVITAITTWPSLCWISCPVDAVDEFETNLLYVSLPNQYDCWVEVEQPECVEFLGKRYNGYPEAYMRLACWHGDGATLEAVRHDEAWLIRYKGPPDRESVEFLKKLFGNSLLGSIELVQKRDCSREEFAQLFATLAVDVVEEDPANWLTAQRIREFMMNNQLGSNLADAKSVSEPIDLRDRTLHDRGALQSLDNDADSSD